MKGSAAGQRPPRLVLASGSPRRRELLGAYGLELEVRPVDLDETPRPDESAEGLAERLARQKATAAAREGELVLAADTVVAVDDELLAKPEDRDDARRMLRILAGRTHRVLTGVALCDRRGESPEIVAAVDITRVRMAALDTAEIDAYVATGEGDDKAGAYAVQGLGALFVEAIEGNWSNVVGLPLPTVARLLRQRGIETHRLLRDARPS